MTEQTEKEMPYHGCSGLVSANYEIEMETFVTPTVRGNDKWLLIRWTSAKQAVYESFTSPVRSFRRCIQETHGLLYRYGGLEYWLGVMKAWSFCMIQVMECTNDCPLTVSTFRIHNSTTPSSEWPLLVGVVYCPRCNEKALITSVAEASMIDASAQVTLYSRAERKSPKQTWGSL